MSAKKPRRRRRSRRRRPIDFARLLRASAPLISALVGPRLAPTRPPAADYAQARPTEFTVVASRPLEETA